MPVEATDDYYAILGVANELMTNLHGDVERVVSAAIQRLADAGATIVRIDVPEADEALQVTGAIIQYERVPAITRFLAAEGTGVTYAQLMAVAGADIQAMAPQPPRAVYEQALADRARLQQAVRARFDEHGLVALAYPTTFEPAPKIGDNEPVGR